MKKLLLTLLLAGIFNTGYLFSQENVNNPGVVFEYMKKSPIMFKIEELKDTILPPDRSKNLLENKFRRIKDSSEYIVMEYDELIYKDRIFIDAEKLFSEGKYQEALLEYKNLYQKYPDFTMALTMQGLCLIKSGNQDDAIDVLRDAVSDNFIDFQAHKLLADIYANMELLDVAIRHILYAHILNRNDSEINIKRIELFKKKGLNTSSWVFVPQVKFEATKSDVDIYIKPQYEGYGMVDAVWRYDDDYKKTKKNADAKFNLNRFQEIVVAQAFMLSRTPWYAETEEGRIIKKVIETRMVNEFIYYEIILPDNPEEVRKLSEDIINKLEKYLMTVRGEVK